ncbi:DEAD/DEAH box helicase [Aquimarina sp. 2201CG1-2-11]|uniref:DEAD/DEAH box helicase n=1 Tax=Aquimarina discodermiae TaxID=3231043 RepID=UPI003462A1CE
MNKNIWNIDKYFNLITETDNEVILPRGAIGQLLRFCREQKIEFDFQDKRNKVENLNFVFSTTLLKHQQAILPLVHKKDFGVIVAPPGSGKTVIALKIIADKKQPVLIIVHRKQLLEQWIERIESFLKIPKKEIGKIVQGKTKIGKQITIAMIQSLTKKIDDIKTVKAFKTIIVDECHHIPAETYSTTLSKLSTYYQYGLTATPFRKYNDGKLIFAHLRELIAEIKPQDIETFKKARVVIRNTNLNIPFNSKTDHFETLSKVLVHDSNRNKRILTDIIKEVNNGRKIVVITKRKEHIIILHQFLKQTCEVITLSGDDSENDRNIKWGILKEGNYQALITTGQFFGEGTDLQNVTCLFLVYPFSFKGKLIQYIGRVQRSEITPIIYDYRDHQIEYLERLFLKRNTYYRNLDKQATLFDDILESATVSKNNTIIKKRIKISIDQLDFRYGTIAFIYKDSSFSNELEFEIENDYIRPEFDVLKPYFSKILESKNVEIDIQAEIENNILVSQLASSNDLENINREIIETVRFTFIEKTFFGNKSSAITKLDLDKNQKDTDGLYQSTRELLEDILKNKNVKHFRQLQYLATNHMDTVLKLRYVLNPFAFVFLLSGENQFHLVLETLNTEEATYVWHIEKDITMLKENLKLIDRELNIIKNEGRQLYLQSQPTNFSRIIHDYSNDKNGFILWRDQLEEKLY